MLEKAAFGFSIAGAFGLAASSLALATAGGRRHPAIPAGGVYAAIAAGALALIAFDNFGPSRWCALADAAEIGLTLAAGPAFFIFVCALAGRARPDVAALAGPAGVAALAACAMSSARAAGIDIFGFDIRAAVIVQIGYTAALALFLYGDWRATGPQPAHKGLLALAGMGLVHAIQVARMAAPENAALAGALPATFAAVGLLALALTARAVALSLPTSARKAQRPFAPQIEIEDLRRLLRDNRGHERPDFRLADLAALAGLSLDQTSAALNAGGAGGFHVLITGERLRAAILLLEDPAEERTSIEAIALLSGFRSRSAFYRAFHEAYGVSPGAWRDSRNSCPARPVRTSA